MYCGKALVEHLTDVGSILGTQGRSGGAFLVLSSDVTPESWHTLGQVLTTHFGVTWEGRQWGLGSITAEEVKVREESDQRCGHCRLRWSENGTRKE